MPLAIVAASIALAIPLLHTARPASGFRGHSTGLAAKAPTFTGAAVCARCHQQEFQLWNGSHHQLAMLPATASSVLGNFDDVSVSSSGATTRFFRRDGNFMVRTEGPDSLPHDYPIAFTFGIFPLQQYLIELPGGRLQAFDMAWDSRPRSEGGRRWFSLHPGESPRPGEAPFWTGPQDNWNYMCADCHSTNVRKNYRPDTRTYSTTYAEIDVSCEACHGPGSNHVAWAEKPGKWRRPDPNEGLTVTFNGDRTGSWTIDAATGNVVADGLRRSGSEIEVCARCHSRRGEIHEDYVDGQPLGDDYRVALLDPAFYFPDGQIKGEVYEYGSFIQSRMYHAGVTCGDCHDPHSLQLRAQGNRLCLRCHAASYDSPRHYFHEAGAPGSRCVECHMPTRTYMVIDARRDHSLRIPRPDLSVALGVPNACNECHRDRSATWAEGVVTRWYGHQPVGFQRFARTLQAGSIGAPGALDRLAALVTDHNQPAIARASALTLMGGYPAAATIASVRGAVLDPSPQVRRAAADALADADPRARAAVLAPLPGDPVRAVRLEAAEVLAGTPANGLPRGVQRSLSRAIDEYIAAQELNADRPEAHLNLASLFAAQRRFSDAAAQLAAALSLDPTFTPAAVNLADMDRELGRDADGERVLRSAIARSPGDASLQYSLGLLLIRRGNEPDALGHLAAANQLDQGNAQFAYVYALALKDTGQPDKAIAVLQTNVASHPYDRDSLAALAQLYQSKGESDQALAVMNRLSRLGPNGAAKP